MSRPDRSQSPARSGDVAVLGPVAHVTDDDVPELVSFVNAAYYHGDHWWLDYSRGDYDRTSEEEVRSHIASAKNGTGVFIAQRDDAGRFATCVYCGFDGMDGCGSVAMLTVRPDLAGRGFGAAILAELERRLPEHCVALEAGVVSNKPRLVAYYERQGFAQVATAPLGRFKAHLLRLDDPVQFVVLVKQLPKRLPDGPS